MEGISASMYTKMKGYLSRRGYERINGSGRIRRKRPVELGSGSSTSRGRGFSLRIKIKPKLKILKMSSPRKFFVWLRDAYVKMMLGLANSRAIGTSGYGDAFGARRPVKEYDEKMIVQIYKSLVMTQGQLVPRDAASKMAVRNLEDGNVVNSPLVATSRHVLCTGKPNPAGGLAYREEGNL
ncbi:hypothetical protein POTOM_046899 [Populus tomentosa]|uniref:Uncharacterized protein n=1 Tax=Populus tomentosa TaxID=118781 RepID=A0A8X8CEB7_POPTO|nr:hypothetical protein POTOM_046899 [Populus tomentosa]